MENSYPDSLLDLVSILPPFNSNHLNNKTWIDCNDIINNWIDDEKQRWEDDLMTKIPKEKMGMYLWREVAWLLDNFHDYIPYTEEEWEKEKYGEEGYFCLAIEKFVFAINDLMLLFDVEDEYIKKIIDYCWFIYGYEDEDYDEGNGKIEETDPNLQLQIQRIKNEGNKYFERAVECGLMKKPYKWISTKFLLACFAREFSLKLHLNKGQNSDGTERISWKPFEKIFRMKNLRGAYNDIQKTGQNPKGAEIIDRIFEE
jgi:hypothetical protein